MQIIVFVFCFILCATGKILPYTYIVIFPSLPVLIFIITSHNNQQTANKVETRTYQCVKIVLLSILQPQLLIQVTNVLLHKVWILHSKESRKTGTRLLLTSHLTDKKEMWPSEKAKRRVNDLSVCKVHGSKDTETTGSGKTPLTP